MYLLFILGIVLAYRALPRAAVSVKRALPAVVVGVGAVVFLPGLGWHDVGGHIDIWLDDALLAGVAAAAATVTVRSVARRDVAAPLMAAAWTLVLVDCWLTQAALVLVVAPLALLGVGWSIREHAERQPAPADHDGAGGKLARVAARGAIGAAGVVGAIAVLFVALFVLYSVACSEGCWD
ncbi:MAG: hypothetical protein JWN72_782 [Thermoleophilia bacterium]|nr:hypothetical protein [Thermoleophilia bacterium]